MRPLAKGASRPSGASARPAVAEATGQADAERTPRAVRTTTRPASRLGARDGEVGATVATPGPVLQPNAARARHSITTGVQTPVHRRESTGGTTPLSSYAAVDSALRSPAGVPAATEPRRSWLGRATQAWRAATGMSEPVAWLQQRVRSLRAETLDGESNVEPLHAAGAGLQLGRLPASRPVARFWQQDAAAAASLLGPHQADLVDALEALGQAHGPHVGLGLSFALVSATQAARDRSSATVVPDRRTLQAFHGDDPVPLILAAAAAADAAMRGGRDARAGDEPPSRMALDMLRNATVSNQFDALARAMAPGLSDSQLRPLRRFLEADAVCRAGHGDRLAPRATDAGLAMARRVCDAARQQLQPDGAALDRRQTVDCFLWDNHFRDDGQGSALAVLKSHFASVVGALAAEPRTGGLLSAACTFGLCGADRHLLTDEASRLAALRDGVDLQRLFEGLRVAVEGQLTAALQEPPVPQAPNRLALTLARHIALDDWSPARRRGLSLEDMVRGRAHGRDCAAVRARVEAACDQLELQGDEEWGARPVRLPERAQLHARVQGELSLIRLGFEDLFRLAKTLRVPLDPACRQLADQVATLVHGHTRRPGARTPSAVGEMLGAFLQQVQFGNHARMSHLSAATLSARGAGLNIAALEEGSALAGLGPQAQGLAVVPAANFAFEKGREQVLRVGAATHGVEIFLGHGDEAVSAEGIGLGAGFPNDRSAVLRAAAGVDALYRGQRTHRLEGAMLRVDRRIVEDRPDGDGGRVFRQNDEAVRATASTLMRFLFERAPGAVTDGQRERLLEDLIERFHDQGLSITLMTQHAATSRSDIQGSVGASAAMGPADVGVRIGGSVGLGVQHAPSTEVSQRDSTGTYQVSMQRRGWFTRTSVSGGVSAGVYVGAGGLPPVPLLRGTATRDEIGGAVRVRVPTHEGRIVPEKTFSDTDTADPSFMKEIVLARKQAWVDLFAFPHRGDPDQGRAKGEQALDAFFHTIDAVRAGNHRYYARERLHPDVGQRLDELASLAALAPACLPFVRDEVAVQRRRLLSDDRSWAPASLIAYERNGVEQGAAGGVGAQVRHVMAAEGEREFVFHTPGWAHLRSRERTDAARPASLADIDRRAGDAMAGPSRSGGAAGA